MPTVYLDTSATQAVQRPTGRLPSRQLIESKRSPPAEGLALDKTFTDKASGKDVKRPQLEAMQSFVRDGDTVFCHSMDRLAHNLDDLQGFAHVESVAECHESAQLEIAKGCHKVFDLASRRGFTGFEVALNA
jgi:hypothetical protein